MNESVLNTIKKMLGLSEDYDAFDIDIIVLINSALATLAQVGIGPYTGFRISGADETWESVVGDRLDLESVKEYVYLKVRTIFDPPTSGTVMDAYKSQLSELEWRLNVRE